MRMGMEDSDWEGCYAMARPTLITIGTLDSELGQNSGHYHNVPFVERTFPANRSSGIVA